MTTEALRLELGKMLDRYDEARRLARDRQQQAKADDALFLQRFADLRRGVVRPMFEAVGGSNTPASKNAHWPVMLNSKQLVGHQILSSDGTGSGNGAASTQSSICFRSTMKVFRRTVFF